MPSNSPGLPPSVPEDQNAQGDLFPHQLLQQMITVERERIESVNRRTEVARFAIEKNDDADRRQYGYHMARLQSEDNDRMRRHKLGSKALVGGGIFCAVVLLFLLGMTFFGEPDQAQLAIRVLAILAIGIGGYGVIAAIRTVFATLFAKNSK